MEDTLPQQLAIRRQSSKGTAKLGQEGIWGFVQGLICAHSLMCHWTGEPIPLQSLCCKHTQLSLMVQMQAGFL